MVRLNSDFSFKYVFFILPSKEFFFDGARNIGPHTCLPLSYNPAPEDSDSIKFLIIMSL